MSKEYAANNPRLWQLQSALFYSWQDRDIVAKEWESAWQKCHAECTQLRHDMATLRSELEACKAREKMERVARKSAEEGKCIGEEKLRAELDCLRTRCLAEAECHMRAAAEVCDLDDFSVNLGLLQRIFWELFFVIQAF